MPTDRMTRIEDFVAERNRAKILFTAGPASLLPENLQGLRPCFGRGDEDYAAVEERVLTALGGMTGHRRVARLQGSASLALEIMALNFLYGKVLVVDTGYYSDRLKWLAESAQRRQGAITEVRSTGWEDLEHVSGPFDWVVACSVETSRGLRLPIALLADTAKRSGARLMLDATASIGLESGHEQADVIGYSSCKGLFGLTGGAFVAFNEAPDQEVDSFYLSLETHLERKMTGPYHAIASLVEVLPHHDDFRAAVEINKARCSKEMADWLIYPEAQQPLLCTYVDRQVSATDPRAILYTPRSKLDGSVICHLGEVHLGREAKGEILDYLEVSAHG